VRYIAPFVAAAADYKVTQLLPAEDDDYQYRIKNAAEPHKRMVKESQLQRERVLSFRRDSQLGC
jgi:hypothetical protein